MTDAQYQYRISHRNARIVARRVAKPARRANMWRMWRDGMSTLRAIHREISEKLMASRRMDEIYAKVGEDA
jgi:hypothetical protein